MMYDNESSTMVLRRLCFLCAFQGSFSTYATPVKGCSHDAIAIAIVYRNRQVVWDKI